MNALRALGTGLLLALLLGGAAPARPRELVEDAAHGFRMELPAGWTRQQVSAAPLQLRFYPPDPDALQLALYVYPGAALGAERRRDEALAQVAGKDDYRAPRRLEGAVAGHTVPGLEVELRALGRWHRLRQLYLEEGDTLFVLQSSAAAKSFEQRRELADAVWATFTTTERAPRGGPALAALAERCGSEVAWAADWEDAVARARAERAPILVVVRSYPGFALSDQLKVGPFMDQDVIALVNARTVPLYLTPDMECPLRDPAVYGMSPTTFGTGVLVVTPEAEVLRDGPQPTYEFLRAAVAAAPDLPGASRARSSTRWRAPPRTSSAASSRARRSCSRASRAPRRTGWWRASVACGATARRRSSGSSWRAALPRRRAARAPPTGRASTWTRRGSCSCWDASARRASTSSEPPPPRARTRCAPRRASAWARCGARSRGQRPPRRRGAP